MKEIGSFSESKDYHVKTVFFGGGTPSILDGREICRIMEKIYAHFNVDTDVEMTIEVNPGTGTEEKLRYYHKTGINRLSFGLQSVHEQELRMLGRIHTFETFLDSFKMARSLNFTNINVDLMSALPGQTCALWEESLSKVLMLKPEHISAYSLIIEDGTPFCRLWEEGKLKLPDEDEERKMYHRTKEILAEAGYERYEISNYARKGFECRHNVGYWTGVEYVGFGLGASSLLSNIRLKNTEDLESYIKNNKFNTERIFLTLENQMEEFMFLGLRLGEGVAVYDFKEKFGKNIDQVYGEVIKRHQKDGLLSVEEGKIRLTQRGMDFCNYVLADFLL